MVEYMEICPVESMEYIEIRRHVEIMESNIGLLDSF